MAQFANLVPENIKEGIDVGGVLGELVGFENLFLWIGLYGGNYINPHLLSGFSTTSYNPTIARDTFQTTKGFDLKNKSLFIAVTMNYASQNGTFKIYINENEIYSITVQSNPSYTVHRVSLNSGDKVENATIKFYCSYAVGLACAYVI